jgi:arsenate reductase
MGMITIYHNPRCSKSREALELLQQFTASRDIALDVIDYQQTPLSQAQLSRLRQQLGAEAGDMVRANEEEFAALDLHDADADGVLAALAAHPKLLQRPIVVAGDAAIIARPPERLHAWLEKLPAA